MILSMQIANTAGHTKKVVTNAVLFLGYCTGNLAGPFFYKDAQKYVSLFLVYIPEYTQNLQTKQTPI